MITRVLILYDVKRKQNTALELSEYPLSLRPTPDETSEEGDAIALE